MTKYASIPEYSQYVEYVTQGELVDGEYQVIINHVDMRNLELVESAEMLKDAYKHVEKMGRLKEIDEKLLTELKSKLPATMRSSVAIDEKKITPIKFSEDVISAKKLEASRR